MSDYYQNRKHRLNEKLKLYKFNNNLTKVNNALARLDELERAREGFASDGAQAEIPPEVPVDEGTPDFSQLTVPELKDIAKQGDIEGYSSMRKAELIEAIEAHIEG